MAIQVVCGVALAYVVAFAALWVAIWTSAAALAARDPQLVTHGPLGLGAGLGVCLAVATGLAWVIIALRGAQVREAFGRSEPAAGSR